MDKDSKIYIAGHQGMVGLSLVKKLTDKGYTNLIYRTFQELDLRNQASVNSFFQQEKPEFVFLIAAKVGGINANISYPAEFLYDNLMIQSNIIHSAHLSNVKKLMFLGSSCIYPKHSPQPMKEEYLLTGKLEPTNEGYAIAKIAGMKLCEFYRKQYNKDFISVMPCNLYGINDNFNLESSHVVPGLIRRFHEAKVNNLDSVTLWGAGIAKRELLFVDDLADACYFLMQNYSDYEHINIGTGEDIEIKELAKTIKEIVGFKGDINYDSSKPDGMLRKVLDTTKLSSLGWKYKISLNDGLTKTYNWFLDKI